MSRHKKLDRTKPIVFNELNLCYFAALISGLRLIDDKARARGQWRLATKWNKVKQTEELTGLVLPDMDADALVKYVQVTGDAYANALAEDHARLGQQNAVE